MSCGSVRDCTASLNREEVRILRGLDSDPQIINERVVRKPIRLLNLEERDDIKIYSTLGSIEI